MNNVDCLATDGQTISIAEFYEYVVILDTKLKIGCTVAGVQYGIIYIAFVGYKRVPFRLC